MNLYLVSQTSNSSYDTYDSFVVACNSEDEARHTHPEGYEVKDEQEYRWCDWTYADEVIVKLIGVASKGLQGVICASFNAG